MRAGGAGLPLRGLRRGPGEWPRAGEVPATAPPPRSFPAGGSVVGFKRRAGASAVFSAEELACRWVPGKPRPRPAVLVPAAFPSLFDEPHRGASRVPSFPAPLFA